MGARILVVDDSAFIHELVRDILEARGFSVEKAMNGHEAMVAIGQSPPDLVLLDIVMPEMSGYQVCRLIRGDERTRALPVVMMTAKDTQKDRYWGMEVGADAYVTKPIDERALVSTIEGLLAQRRLPAEPLAREELTRESLQGRAGELLEGKLLELTILHEVGKLGSWVSRPEVLLQNALALVGRVIDYDQAAALVSFPGAHSKRLALRTRRRPLKLSKKTLLARSVELLAREQGCDPAELRRRDTAMSVEAERTGDTVRAEPASEAAVVLTGPQGPLGVLLLFSARAGRFSGEDRALAEVIAGQLAVLLGNAALLEEREERIEILKVEKRRVDAILRNLGEGVLVTDWSYSIIHANPLAHQLLGVEPGGLAGSALFDHIPKAAFHVLEDQHIGEVQPVWEARTASIREGRPLSARFGLVDEEEEKTLGLIILLRDITAEQELDRQKSRFLENMSSQMRDPLTSLRGFLDLLREEMGDSRPRQRQYMDVMSGEVVRLTELVDDLLSLSRIELPDYHLNREFFSVSEAILHSIMSNQETAQAREVALKTELSEKMPRVWADRDSVIDVLNRLISNALKFSPPRGEVVVGARRLPAPEGDGGTGGVEVFVRDSGPGVPEDRKETIFLKYRPLHHYVGDPGRGSGMGLPICKRLVEMNGGAIRLESAPGRGSTFAFTLPEGAGGGG
jgi:signal transduction histidine kinase/CheY-like chemotaxis protein